MPNESTQAPHGAAVYGGPFLIRAAGNRAPSRSVPEAALRDEYGRSLARTIRADRYRKDFEFSPLREARPGEVAAFPKKSSILPPDSFRDLRRVLLECGRSVARSYYLEQPLKVSQVRLELGAGMAATADYDVYGGENAVWLRRGEEEVGVLVPADCRPATPVSASLSRASLQLEELGVRSLNALVRKFGPGEVRARLSYTVAAMEIIARTVTPYRRKFWSIAERLKLANSRLRRLETAPGAAPASAREITEIYSGLGVGAQLEVSALVRRKAAAAGGAA